MDQTLQQHAEQIEIMETKHKNQVQRKWCLLNKHELLLGSSPAKIS